MIDCQVCHAQASSPLVLILEAVTGIKLRLPREVQEDWLSRICRSSLLSSRLLLQQVLVSRQLPSQLLPSRHWSHGPA